jgi:hypothetical protein
LNVFPALLEPRPSLRLGGDARPRGDLLLQYAHGPGQHYDPEYPNGDGRRCTMAATSAVNFGLRADGSRNSIHLNRPPMVASYAEQRSVQPCRHSLRVMKVQGFSSCSTQSSGLRSIEMLQPSVELAPVVVGQTKSRARIGRPRTWDWDSATTYLLTIAQEPDGLPTGPGLKRRSSA